MSNTQKDRDRLSAAGQYGKQFALLVAFAAFAVCPRAAYGDQDTSASRANPYDTYFISSFGTDELMRYDVTTGRFLGVVMSVSKPVASQIGFGGDLFLSASGSGDVLRFDGF